MNTALILLAVTMETVTCSWKESMSTTMKPPVIQSVLIFILVIELINEICHTFYS